MPADAFLHCSNTDKTCAGQRRPHRRREFCDGQNDMAVAPRLSQCVDVGYTENAPSTAEVQGGIQAGCVRTHCPDRDTLLCKQYKQLILIKRLITLLSLYQIMLFMQNLWTVSKLDLTGYEVSNHDITYDFRAELHGTVIHTHVKYRNLKIAHHSLVRRKNIIHI